MPRLIRKNTLQLLAIARRRPSLLRRLLLPALGLVVLVPKHAAPLLDLLLEVAGVEDGVVGAVQDLHARPLAVRRRARVHGFGRRRPSRGRLGDLALGARLRPFVDFFAVAAEAARGHARVDGAGADEFGVGGGEDVLESRKVSFILLLCQSFGRVGLTVIMAPELLPRTKTLFLSTRYLSIAYLI